MNEEKENTNNLDENQLNVEQEQQDEGFLDLDSIVEDTEESGDSKTIKSLLAQKNHWKKKFENLSNKKEEMQTKETNSGDLSQKDLIALMKSNINEDDIEEVVEYSKLKGISVTDALKSNLIKNLINEKEEQRRVANATNTGGSKKKQLEKDVNDLVSDSKKGILPDREEDLERLILNRLGK